MENQNNTETKAAMTYGLYMGLVLVLSFVIFYVIGTPFSDGSRLISDAIIIGGLFWGIRSLREHMGDEGLPYSRALGFGTLFSLFASLIFAFFTFVLYKIIDPGLLDKFMIFLEQNWLRLGYSDNQIELMVSIVKKGLTPFTYSFLQIFIVTITGFMFSLIIAIFLRRKPSNPFHGIE